MEGVEEGRYVFVWKGLRVKRYLPVELVNSPKLANANNSNLPLASQTGDRCFGESVVYAFISNALTCSSHTSLIEC